MRGAVVGRFNFPAMRDSYILNKQFFRSFMMNDMNELLKCVCEYEEWQEQEKQNSTRARRFRRSKLDDYRLEILQKKAAGKSFQQIADYLLNAHKVACDRTTVFDFYTRCISE